GLHYGHAVARGATLGGSVDLVRERLANASAMTYAFGVGGTLDPAAWPGLRLGVSAQHLGPPASYTIDGTAGEGVALAASVQAGASYVHAAGPMNLRGALEGRFTRGRNGVAMVGAELAGATGASLRLGVRVNDSASSVSAGAGYAMGALRLDYAFVPYR